MATKYIYRRDSSRLFIALRDNGKRFKIYLPVETAPVIDGEELPVRISDISHNTFCFTKENKRYFCIITGKDQNRYTVLVNGIEYKFSVESISSYLRGRILQQQNTTESNHNLHAPMPGRVAELFISEGDLVNSGEALMSLEAMKMQNELQASGNAIVKKIHVHPGQNVLKDELLIELEPIDD